VIMINSFQHSIYGMLTWTFLLSNPLAGFWRKFGNRPPGIGRLAVVSQCIGLRYAPCSVAGAKARRSLGNNLNSKN